MELEKITEVLINKNYTVYTKGIFNLNIVGIRSVDSVPNRFDDWLAVFYKDISNEWVYQKWPITTDPGLPWLLRPLNKEGTAILKEGQYKSVYQLDLHNGKYLALCQRLGSVTVYRDGNKDGILDLNENNLEIGMFGINIHRASLWGLTPIVNRHSAGCQVFQNIKDFSQFIKTCELSASIYGNKFTYTLLNEKDLYEIF